MRVPSELGRPCMSLQVVSGPQEVEVWRHDPSHRENGYFIKDMMLDLKMHVIATRVMSNTGCMPKSDWLEEQSHRVATVQFSSFKKYVVRYYSRWHQPKDQQSMGESMPARLVVVVDCGETILCSCCGSELA